MDIQDVENTSSTRSRGLSKWTNTFATASLASAVVYSLFTSTRQSIFDVLDVVNKAVYSLVLDQVIVQTWPLQTTTTASNPTA